MADDDARVQDLTGGAKGDHVMTIALVLTPVPGKPGVAEVRYEEIDHLMFHKAVEGVMIAELHRRFPALGSELLEQAVKQVLGHAQEQGERREQTMDDVLRDWPGA